ncbi:tRNA (adenosine(37)-N6)-dimethylallyltransferase MiaA [bacterium]|nr:tRNA (adenosine(37)-N6)-dimethylallyltransferase MiaA [bacterium]
MKPHVIAVVGPTASGKTSLAIQIAHEIDGEIISADSRLVYKGFDIAAAKPTIEEREGISHYLIDIAEPEHDYSAGDWERDAKKAISEIISRGKTPIIAGGTGLYFRVLLEHYALPQAETNYELRKTLNLREKEDLLIELKNIDPVTYERVKDADKRRIVRALEIIDAIGKPLGEISIQKEPDYDVEWKMPVLTSREDLYEKINKRVDLMIEKGIVDETKSLLEKHGRIPNFVNTIGYKEILPYIDGECSLEEAADKLKQHTRNYAKRQLTWFRKNPNLKIEI